MSRYTEVTKVSHGDYLKLVGLDALSASIVRQLDLLRTAACEITGERNETGGHTDEFVWSGGRITVSELLRKLGISVEQPVSANP